MKNKRIFQAYYTNSSPITDYMVQSLSIKSNMRLLEPAAGEGVFIDALLKMNNVENLAITAYEIDPNAFGELEAKYQGQSNVDLKFSNMLFDTELDEQAENGGVYDYVIANPPYGGWLDYSQRQALKNKYPDIYVKETYALFLYRCIQLLKPEGRLVFIIPSTFLNLHMHTKLRRWLFENTTIHDLSLFPASFFPNVSFGYAKMCIVSLEKTHPNKLSQFNVYTGYRNVEDLTNKNSAKQIYTINQQDVLSNIDHALFISDNPKVMELINNAPIRIDDVSDCVTGFYSGNDKMYLRTTLTKKRYEVVCLSEVHDEKASRNLINGLDDELKYIPIVKGGAGKYIKPDEWFMFWTPEAVKNYKASKKARFQNSSYYFQDGIAVPMVSSSRITGALLESRLFDQSIVGVFPKDDKYKLYLLGFFNSPTCNLLIRTINPSANNSAKYLRKLPFITPSEQSLRTINKLVQKMVDGRNRGIEQLDVEVEIEKNISDIYGF